MRRAFKDQLKEMKSDQSGFILVMALFVIVVLFLLGTTLAILGIQEFTLSARTKMMDQAYSNADAGVNRAAVYIQMNTSLSQNTTPGPYPTPQYVGASETFNGAGNGYTYTIYQSDTQPSNSNYKIIRATGTITKGDKTAQRTIETRIVVGAGGDEYDASFDYCIYNGFQFAGAGQDTWPCTTAYVPITYWAGTFTVDGKTAFNGRTPRGALYTRGNINIPTELASSVTLMGNVVATKNITLHNAWNIGVAGPGIVIDGNAIAGIGATGGDATFSGVATGTLNPCRITGYLCAAGNVSVTSTATISLTGQTLDFGYNGGANSGGIIAGNNVTIDSTANLFCQLKFGQIYCAKKLVVRNIAAQGLTVYFANTGREVGTGIGADLTSQYTWNWVGQTLTCNLLYSQGELIAASNAAITLSLTDLLINEGHVGTNSFTNTGGTGADLSTTLGNATVTSLTSRGRVNATGGTVIINVGNIWAGTDDLSNSAAGMGVRVNAGGAGFTIGNLKGHGKIDVDTGGVGGSVGTMWSGGNIDFNSTQMGVGIGSISAVGSINFNTNIILGGVGVGRVSANGSVVLHATGVGAVYVDALKAGGNVDAQIYGAGWMVFHAFDNSGWNAGVGNPGNTWGGYSVAGDAVDAGGSINFGSDAGWVTLEGDTYNWLAFEDCGDAEAGYGISAAWWQYDDDENSNVGALRGWTPGVPDPGSPAMPSMAADGKPFQGPTTSLGTTSAWLYTTPPTVDRTLLLRMAGLTGEVNLLEPNWAYFKTAAQQDDMDNPSVPHMIRDTGNVADGDYDGVAGNGIYFKWDNSSGHVYSTNETVYAADDHDININLDWAGTDANFKGTIVTKGNIYMGKSGVNWTVNRNQEANMVAGVDIVNNITGLALSASNNCSFHLWAKRNIDLSNHVLCLAGTTVFTGSFTAGNLVTYSSRAVWDNFTMRWSRWALDPVAWAPPFKVLTWKEI